MAYFEEVWTLSHRGQLAYYVAKDGLVIDL